MQLWDVRTGSQIGAPLNAAVNSTNPMAFSSDGKILATNSGSNDDAVRLWNVGAESQIGALISGHVGNVQMAAFSPNGKILATAAFNGLTRLWNVDTREQIGGPFANPGAESMVFSSDGKIIAITDSYLMLRLWDVATHHQIGTPLPGSDFGDHPAAFSPDGETLAVVGPDGIVRLWDVATRRLIGEPLIAHNQGSVAFSPNGQILATGSGRGPAIVRLWDVTTHQQIGSPLNLDLGPNGGVDSVAFSSDGKTLTVIAQDLTVTSAATESVRLWDVATHQQIGSPIGDPADVVYWAAVSPDGATVATANPDGTVQFWDSATGNQIGASPGNYLDASNITFSPDGKIVAIGSNGTVRFLDSSYTVNIEAQICAEAGQPLTQSEWRLYALGIAFQPICDK